MAIGVRIVVRITTCKYITTRTLFFTLSTVIYRASVPFVESAIGRFTGSLGGLFSRILVGRGSGERFPRFSRFISVGLLPYFGHYLSQKIVIRLEGDSKAPVGDYPLFHLTHHGTYGCERSHFTSKAISIPQKIKSKAVMIE